MDELEALALAAAARARDSTPAQRFGQRAVDFARDAAPAVNDVARSSGSGIARGAVGLAEIPSLPGRLMDSALAAGGRFFGADEDHWTQGPSRYNQESDPPARELAERLPGMDAALSYSPQTTAGEYAQTIGEFLPGAMIGPGGYAGNALRYGVAPALASETAGQATEGTAVEPYARIAAALGTTMLTGRPTNNARPVLPRADPEDARMAETLMRSGIRPTVGQTTRSNMLRWMEGTDDILESQVDDFTSAAMRSTGSSASRASPRNLRDATRNIVREMNDILADVDVNITDDVAARARGVADQYLSDAPAGSVVRRVGDVADELEEIASMARQLGVNGASISAAQLRKWRSALGRMTVSNDEATRTAAQSMRRVIDAATDDALRAAGRADDIARMGTLRDRYRNMLAVSDASTRGGAEASRITPQNTRQAVIRTQGRPNVAAEQGTTELAPLTRAGNDLLRPMPTVAPGGVRSVSPLFLGGGTGAVAGANAGMNLISPPWLGAAVGGTVGAGGGAAMTSLAQAMMRSNPVQSMMMDPRSRLAQALLRTGPGAYATSQ